MQPQPNQPLSYLHQALNQQSMSQPPMNPQQLSQQPLSQQPMGQQSLGQQPISQQQMNQPSMSQQQMSQQPMSQQPMSQPAQQNDSPHAQSQPALPPAPSQVPQVQQVQQAQQSKQQRTPPRPEAAEPAQENHHDDDDMDVGSQDESGDGEGSSLEAKLIEAGALIPRQPMGPMMSAPPEGGSFPTLEAVHKHVLSYCISVGYAIVIGRSKKTVPGLKKVLFVCDRAGKPPRRINPEVRKRKTTSRKCDCQFGFFAIEQRTQWTVRYRPDPAHLQHNHGPSDSPLHHPAARKLDSKMVAAVKALKESGMSCLSNAIPPGSQADHRQGVGVSQTLEILHADNPDVRLLPRDIYNARAAINRNPVKVATDLAENRPAIYSKPHPSAEERIRADLRREIAKAREELDKVKDESKKEIEDLKEQLREKDKQIGRFEMFIDICNQRVMMQRERLSDGNEANGGAGSSNP